MNEHSLNTFLQAGRKAAEVLYQEGNPKAGSNVLQITSLIALKSLPPSHKVLCSCGKWLRIGKEVEFYNHTSHCYSCESAYIESYQDMM